MRAAAYSDFGGPTRVRTVAEPQPGPQDVVITVKATGICRSDWHGWQGHDADITTFPHVPGHEFAGVVDQIGDEVDRWTSGDRVAVPFVSGCGRCGVCVGGDPQICPDQTQAGFTHWGSFAERVLVREADFNLVALPEPVGFAAGAALGCRFSTAYRAVVDQGRVGVGDVVAVYGCGGVGISAVMIAVALGATAIGIDPRPQARALATRHGAARTVAPDDAPDELAGLAQGGPDVTVDAVGSSRIVADAVAALRPGGRHVQVGLLPEPGAFGEVVAGRVVAKELAIVGSHGIAPSGLAGVLELTASGTLRPDLLIGSAVDLDTGADLLMRLADDPALGITVIDSF